MTTGAMLVVDRQESWRSVDAYAEIIATRPLGILCTVVHQWIVGSGIAEYIKTALRQHIIDQ